MSVIVIVNISAKNESLEELKNISQKFFQIHALLKDVKEFNYMKIKKPQQS